MSNPFRALLWKEWREVWGLVIPIGLVISMMMFWSVGSAQSINGDPDPARHFQWLALVGSLAALSMAYRQTSRERTVDQWAFTLHRPAGGAEIVGAKLVVGIGSIIGVMFVPFALAMLRYAIPGFRAVPFDRAYWLPGIADVFTAIMFYACGLHIGIRLTHRPASRIIGAVVGLGGYVAVTTLSSFWLALALTTTISVVMIAAAWSDYMTASTFDAKPWWGRAASVTAAIPAVAALFTLGIGTIGWFSPGSSPSTPTSSTPVQVFVNASGMLDTVASSDVTVGHGVIMTDLIPTTESATNSTNNLGFRQPGRWVTRLHAETHSAANYYERRDGLISIYDPMTRLLRGYLGPDGFAEGASKPANRFPGHLQDAPPPMKSSPTLLVLSGGVYLLEELKRPTRILPAQSDETILAAKVGAQTGGMVPEERAKWGWYRAVVTTKRVYLLDHRTGAEQVSMEHPAADAGTVRIYRAAYGPDSPTYIWYTPRRILSDDTLHQVFEFRRGSTKPVAEYRFGGAMYTGVMTHAPDMRALNIPAAAVPVLTVAVQAYGRQQGLWVGNDRLAYRAMLLSAVSCLIAGAFACWLCRRYAFSPRRTITWTVLAALIGPAVWVAMWMLLEWPSRKALALADA
jgi:hypothetical protein